ncbi:unnamed protein product [Aphanomyces euteiches]
MVEECLVKDFNDHAPTGANYTLPSSVILTSLQDSLALLDKQKKKEMDDENGCMVMLCGAKHDSLELVLTLKAFRSLEAQYVFKMTPMTIEKVAVLEAKIRDLEEALEKKKPVIFSASSTNVASPQSRVVWNSSAISNEDYFELSEDMKVVMILERGLYEIQMTGRVQNWNGMVETVHCLVDGVSVAAALVGESRLFGMNLLLLLDEDSEIKFKSCGKYNLDSGCTLKIVLVQEMSNDIECE